MNYRTSVRFFRVWIKRSRCHLDYASKGMESMSKLASTGNTPTCRLLKRRVWVALSIGALTVTATFSGCALCCAPHDLDYVTYGSRTPRTDRQHGRVGSVFSDSGVGGQVLSQSYEGYPSDYQFDDGVIYESETMMFDDSSPMQSESVPSVRGMPGQLSY